MFAGLCGAALVGLVRFLLLEPQEGPWAAVSDRRFRPRVCPNARSRSSEEFLGFSSCVFRCEAMRRWGGGADVGKVCWGRMCPPPPAGSAPCFDLGSDLKGKGFSRLRGPPWRCHVNRRRSLRGSLSVWLHLHPPRGGTFPVFSSRGRWLPQS